MKPRVLYIRPEITVEQIDGYRNLYYWREKTLMFYFDLIIVENKNEIEKYNIENEFDLIIFNISDEQKPVPLDSNIKLCKIPKVALLSFDAIGQSVFSHINYFEQLKVDAYFTLDLSLGEYFPSIKEKLFYWPWSINEDDYKDYKCDKRNDILLTTGNFTGSYHWRNSVFPLLQSHYNCYSLSHYVLERKDKRIIGKDFSKLINQTKVVPTCGAFNKIFVLKHLEIPASMSCLLTEETDVIKAMGFIDGVNCIFATPENVLDKVKYYLSDPGKLEKITQNGYHLVWNNHSWRQRPQIYQWLQLKKVLNSEEKIIQEDYFSGLKVLPKQSIEETKHKYEFDFRLNLEQFDKNLFNGQIKDIPEGYYLTFLQTYYPFYPGFVVRQALFEIHRGNVEIAFHYLVKALYNKQAIKDPVLVSLLLLTMLILDMNNYLQLVIRSYNCDSTTFYQLLKILSQIANNDDSSYNRLELIECNEFEYVSNISFFDQSLNELVYFLEPIFIRYKKEKLIQIIKKINPDKEKKISPSNSNYQNLNNHEFTGFNNLFNFPKFSIVKTGSLKLLKFKLEYLIDQKFYAGKKFNNKFIF